MSFDHCCSGKVAEGSPKGSIVKIAGMDVYVAGEKSNRALVIVPDAFGLNVPNTKLIADYVAKDAKVNVYLLDVFHGDAIPGSALQNPEEMKSFDFMKWLPNHNKDKVYPEVVAVVKELKEKHGVSKVAGMGFCYGGWAVGQLSRDQLIDGVIFAHPSIMVFPTDVENLKTPSLWLCCEHDTQVTAEKRLQAQTILGKKLEHTSKFVVYVGTTHGDLIRGDSKEKHIREAAEDAAVQTVLFLNKYIV